MENQPMLVGCLLCAIGLAGFGIDLSAALRGDQAPSLLAVAGSAAIFLFGVAEIAAWWRLRNDR